ncbi:MAG: hypothetical protein AAB588_04025 [Patescibacteria group bacterium]
MLFGKKKSSGSFTSVNLRRRFHHIQLSKRKEGVSHAHMMRPKRVRPLFNFPQLERFKKLFWFVCVGGIFLGVAYTIFFSSFFTITKITVEKEGGAVAGSSLAPFLERMKGKNMIFFKTAALIQEIEQTFKNEILLVRISKSYPHKLMVKVDEYPAVLNLRIYNAEKIQKMVLNQIGYSVFDNTEIKELPVLTLRTNQTFTPKSIVMDLEKVTAITEAFQKFRDLFGMKILEGEWKKTERELHLKTEKNFVVWLDLTADIEAQLAKLKRALPKLDIYREPLEYIDLRIAGGDNERVIFKRK